jgi:hypothetical protein
LEEKLARVSFWLPDPVVHHPRPIPNSRLTSGVGGAGRGKHLGHADVDIPRLGLAIAVGSFAGWTLPEPAVVHRYRRRTA